MKLFIFLTTLQYLIDIQMYPCNNINGYLILYLHHLVDKLTQNKNYTIIITLSFQKLTMMNWIIKLLQKEVN